MRTVKKQIAMNLFDALREANLADLDGANDLDPELSRQNSLYGDLVKAIKSLGYEEEYNESLETGELPDIS